MLVLKILVSKFWKIDFWDLELRIIFIRNQKYKYSEMNFLNLNILKY